MFDSSQTTTGCARSFADELLRLGPDSRSQLTACWNLESASAYCRVFAKGQYENFTVASWLLPKRLRTDFYHIYAYCRWSDNLADEVSDDRESLNLLAWWRDLLRQCQRGSASHPVMLALQSTVTKHRLPWQPFEDLLDAFEQDRRVKRYRDEEQLLDYCQRSANPVGRILLHLSQSADEHTLALSDQICTGLQLTNFCQDLHRDALMGRIYAPRTMWHEHGVTEDMFLAGLPTPPLQALLKAWVAHSREYFDRGLPLLEYVPKWFAVDVNLFVRGGRETLHQIERSHFDVWTCRPTVSKWKKVQLLIQSLFDWKCNKKQPHNGVVTERFSDA